MDRAESPVHVIAPRASVEQAAAIIAAVQRFQSDTAQSGEVAEPTVDHWTQTALIEAIQGGDVSSSVWGDRPLWS